MTDNESEGSSLLSALFTVIFFSVIATSIVSIILATTTESVTFNLEGIYQILAYTGDLVTYGGIVLGFAIGGLIGGVRTKSAETGFISGFFGAFLGGLFAFVLATLDDLTLALETGDFSTYSDVLPPYVIGMIGIMAAASIAGFGAGKATQPKIKAKKRPQSKIKSWDKSKTWKCSNCGTEIPPGRNRCPNCGRAAF